MQYRFAVIYGTLSTIRIVLMTVHSPYQVLTRNRIQPLIKNPGYKTDRQEKKGAAGRIRPSITNPKPDPDQTLEKDRIRPSRKTKSGSDPEKTTWSI